jgi:NAD(P)-dependent dehydrogenase (short-subunit alcohol dehydrogenase family)
MDKGELPLGTLDAATGELGPAAMAVRADLSKLSDLGDLFDAIKARHGRLDIVFANAGGGAPAPLEQSTEDHSTMFSTST